MKTIIVNASTKSQMHNKGRDRCVHCNVVIEEGDRIISTAIAARGNKHVWRHEYCMVRY